MDKKKVFIKQQIEFKGSNIVLQGMVCQNEMISSLENSNLNIS